MTSPELIADFLKQKTIAVVGASRDKQKWGYRVFADLRAAGYQVLPVNPNTASIDGLICYPSLSALPATPDGVVMIVPPAICQQAVADAAAAGIRRIWIQPGAGFPEARAFCQEHGLSLVLNDCILTKL
jgi:predicted CoA-binding protein